MSPRPTIWERVVGLFLENRLVVAIALALMLLGGLMVSPFEPKIGDLALGDLPRDPVPVDAIPDLGENQQIVFTEWPGRSPRDVEDQITYPLTTELLGLAGVRTVRSASALGFSSVYVIFHDDVDYWFSRTRVLEKLSALSPNLLPDGVTPTLGPDATALGQVFWYTLEGQDADGNTVGGWDPDELRAIQDWTVRYALQSVEGVSEVSSIGGQVREWQVDVDPEALRAHGVSLGQVADAVRRSNLDVGARTLEVNGVEYLIRSLGFIQGAEDLEQAVVVARGGTPVRVSDVARVSLGPGLRRGALDDAGAPAVGGVVVSRTQENPKAVIEGVKARIAKLQPSLPRRTLEDGTEAQVTLVPFYDRSVLIEETLGTLSTALGQQLLITALVVLVMLRGLRASLLISALLPLGVLGTFGVMKLTGVDANIMALGGIAIAIGTMVDIGIVFVENIEQRLADAPPDAPREDTVRRAAAEVAPAVVTSVLTTVVSFLPVFGLTAQELRLFGPLAFTKTFAMGVALLMALVVVPGAALLVLRRRPRAKSDPRRPTTLVLAVGAGVLLAAWWSPLGHAAGLLANLAFAGALMAAVLGGFALFERAYPRLLTWVLANKASFLLLPAGIVAFGLLTWAGIGGLTARLPEVLRTAPPVAALTHAFPGLDREYMPPFDEGAFLYMPTTPPHASLGEVLDMLSEMDAAIAEIPEVDRVVGKLGRVDSALDPAPVSMIETLVTYHPEYRTDPDGARVRQWRDHIRSTRDIWAEITRAAQGPGLTSAPPLMPISTRLVMLQSGMRAPMGVKVTGPDLASIERFGLDLEALLKTAPALKADTVFADRVVGKPYLEIELDREAIARHGLRVVDVQEVLQVALGGMPLTRAIEGRERTPVRVRYMREERDSVEAIARIMVPTPSGAQVPLSQLAALHYARGPQVIKSEDTFLTSYVLFDRVPEVSELDAVEQAQALIAAALEEGRLERPEGVRFTFAGSYENLLRSERRLKLLIPVALSLVFILLYLQFRRAVVAAIIYSGVAVAVGGAFSLIWLYGRPGFLDAELMGTSLQALFQVGPMKLSVAVWVGVIALIGLATDDGVVMSTYLDQVFRDRPPIDVSEVRARTLEAGLRRVRPCLMTTATTLLALLPVITSQGRGSDIMVPMALPMVGGMTVALITLFVVPVLWCAVEERRLRRSTSETVSPL